ncbi:MAG TPA: hypothetical protein VFU12_15080 [Glycomyces sp.]|nr:hypothetical protein [Glycomyces sp.]
MKHIKLTYAKGGELEFLTTNNNAAAMVAQFCKGGGLLVERFEYEYDCEDESEWFYRRGSRIVPATDVDRIEVESHDPFDDDEELDILAVD